MTLAIIELAGRKLGLDYNSAVEKSKRYGHRFVQLLGVEEIEKDDEGMCSSCKVVPMNNADEGLCAECQAGALNL
jgi:hypothetical protein